MAYSVDTSALMDAWGRYYPPDVFGALWERLDELARSGRLLAIDEVKRELERKDDALHQWVKDRPTMVVKLDVAIQKRAVAILAAHPSLVDSKSLMRGAADPFVIALAQERKLTVVTAEKTKPSKPKIPDVCEKLGIDCISLVSLFRREGWRV